MHRRFYFLVIVRVILLVVSISVLAFIFGDERLFFNHIILGTIIVLQVLELIRFVNRTNRELSRLFNALIHSDFSITFQGGFRDKSFKHLENSLNQVVNAYKTVKIEREAQFHLLQMLVNQINVGIIAIEHEADISIINPTAEELLNVKGVRNWRLLHQFNPSFTKAVEELGENGRKLIELKSAGQTRMLSVDVHTSSLLDKPHKLITFQDINSEIEQKEIEAWHKLIRILTHEIMNSVTPISSLTETMQGLLENNEGDQRKLSDLSDDTISDIRFSLKTIHKRSEGLLNFVDAYRKLTKTPKPTFERVNVKDLFLSVEKLMHEELNKRGIRLDITVMPTVTSISMDRALIEQVLINLITNSMHALGGRPHPKILMSAYAEGRFFTIEITDNGKGISEKELNDIFVPFFSTRKEGSGIGLSLSKQILSLHGGSIRVRSSPGEGTSFYLNFKS
ncbi:MAG TPA: ATP-binding protein [Cyclobacteriaceae bacterium]|nr:ATP-binding protein [Cyclobacteriaceae bacterium]